MQTHVAELDIRHYTLSLLRLADIAAESGLSLHFINNSRFQLAYCGHQREFNRRLWIFDERIEPYHTNHKQP